MCLAIYKLAGVDVPELRLKAGWQGNSHGAGFCYIKKGRVEIEKGFMKLKDFEDAYAAAVKKNKKSPFLIHFRITSMGHSGADNTHPFLFQHGALIHNGTIMGTGATSGVGPSDTAKFADKYGPKLSYLNVETHKKEFDEALGYNKVAILYRDGRHQILNEDGGVWLDGVWYSNKHFLPIAERFARKET